MWKLDDYKKILNPELKVIKSHVLFASNRFGLCNKNHLNLLNV
jgi:hypothetical protein